MGFNYGLEKKNFDRQWAMLRKQYEDAGMSIEAIQAMYEYDLSVFNAARSYQNHTQEITAPSFEQGEESYSPLMNKYQEAISVTEGVQNRHCPQRRPEHGHLHCLPDPARS